MSNENLSLSDFPPISIEGEASEEEIAAIGANPEQWRLYERRNIHEFGEVEGREQDIVESRKEVKKKIRKTEKLIMLLEDRLRRYRVRQEFLKEVHPEYARDYAELRLEELTEHAKREENPKAAEENETQP